MTIIGVSFDPPSANAAWAADEGFAFELWTDTDKTLALTYGAANNANAVWADRITVVLDENGDLVLEYLDDIQVGTHPDQVYEDCVKLFGS